MTTCIRTIKQLSDRVKRRCGLQNYIPDSRVQGSGGFGSAIRGGCVTVIVCFAAISAYAGLVPEHLRCEYREDPVGIGENIPRFGWLLAPSTPILRDLTQSAYQIVVSKSRARLEKDIGDIWDSGKVLSSETQNLEYEGRPLESDNEYWWKVRVWDQSAKISEWSDPARWTTGLLNRGEWRAKWIGADSDPRGGESNEESAQRSRVRELDWAQAALPASKAVAQTIYVRRGFTVPPRKIPIRASLLLTPDQTCSVTLNGKVVGSATRWGRAMPLNLLPMLHPGDNVIGLRIEQKDGYAPAILGELELRFSDGQVYRCAIDKSWSYATEAKIGWDTPEFDDNLGWRPLDTIADTKTDQFAATRAPWGTPDYAMLILPPAPYLRKDFYLNQPVRRAWLHATALGLYEARLNGEKVGNDAFTPGWTDYNIRVPCQTYDVTSLIRVGKNTIGAILGDGWFAGTFGYKGNRQNYGGYPRFAAQLEIELADGSRTRVISDESWRAANGPILYADILQGYAYNAQRELPGWDVPGYDDSKWAPVASGLRWLDTSRDSSREGVTIENSSVDPVRAAELLSAKTVKMQGSNTCILDFGQNLVGWVRLRIKGHPGQSITIRHGEALNPNGSIYTSNLRSAAATDFYILKGGETEELEPRFTYHGFRYVEISGLNGSADVDDVKAVVAFSHLERTGQFECSSPLINQLYSNIIWSNKGNYFENPTDCPQRDERLGWTGDTQFFIPTACYNYNVASFIERWLLTHATDGQAVDGSFPDVAPSLDRGGKAVTAWGDAALICTHALWKTYGDTRVVTRHFDEMSKYLDLLYVNSSRGIVTVGGYGDWLNLGGSAKTEVIDTAYYAYLCDLMSEMAHAIGRDADADRLTLRHSQVLAAFQRAFISEDGKILESSQTGYALAFSMDLIPPNLRDLSAKNFEGEIAKHNWHLATGFIGTPRLLPSLHAAGLDEVAYRVLFQDTYPSWLYQVKNGATTMWERWDGWTSENGFQSITMNSFNHYAFGSVGEFLYRNIAGIDTDGPGYKHLIFQPVPGVGLTWVRASFLSPSGTIMSAWKIVDRKLFVDATFPPNTSTRVLLPGEKPVEVGSGTYHWEVPWK